jgi:type II secretory pathway pseudopilin PulG
MTVKSKRNSGITLIELMVTGVLFGLFTGMVAGALVQAHRVQDKSVAKLDAIRHASLAEDIMSRDIESGRYAENVNIFSAGAPPATGTYPTFGTTPLLANPLLITRYRKHPNPAITFPQEVNIAYWFEPNADPELPGKVRRAILSPTFPAPGVPEAGSERVVARDVFDFQVSTDPSSMIRLDMWVNTVQDPVTILVATEPNPSPID